METLYHSTRGNVDKISSKQAILKGIAPDGGLYVSDALLDARIDLAEALAAAWSLPKGRRRAAIRARALPAARRNRRAMAAFAAAFRAMWTSHNRPQGMETTQIRLAGAVERAEECVRRLSDFAAGRADTIPELDDLARVDFKPELAGIDGKSVAAFAFADGGRRGVAVWYEDDQRDDGYRHVPATLTLPFAARSLWAYDPLNGVRQRLDLTIEGGETTVRGLMVGDAPLFIAEDD